MKERKDLDKVRFARPVRANEDVDRLQLQLLDRSNALEALDGNKIQRK